MTWIVRDDFAAFIPHQIFDVLDNYEQYPEIERLRDNAIRASFFMKLPGPDSCTVFIKRYKMRTVFDTVKYSLFSSKAISEWKSLNICEEFGLPVPRTLAVAEKKKGRVLKDCCIIMEGLTETVPLNEYAEQEYPPGAQIKFRNGKRLIASSLARLTSAIHQRGIFYRDFHAGNILVTPEKDGECQLFLIDLHRALFLPKVLPRMMQRDVAQLCNSLPANRSDRCFFLKEYCAAFSLSKKAFRTFIRQLASAAERLERRRIKSRSKRCVKNSTVFEIHKTFQEHYCGRRDFGKTASLRAIEQHTRALAMAHPPVIKQTRNSIITAHKQDAELPAVCVKAYPYRGAAHALKSTAIPSRAMNSWRAGNSLLVRNIMTPAPLALLEKKRGPFIVESFLITEWLPDAVELNDYISRFDRQQVSPSVRRSFIRSIAKTIWELHAKGVYHADLKSTNILVQEAGKELWKFYLVDLDRVLFRRALTFSERANNLAQINASVSRVMSAKDRLNFFYFYAKGTSLSRERKKYYHEILRISRTKNTEPFGVRFSPQ